MSINSKKGARFIGLNESFTRMMSYSREELVGRGGRDLNLGVDLNQRARALSVLEEQGSVRDMERSSAQKAGKSGLACYQLKSSKSTARSAC